MILIYVLLMVMFDDSHTMIVLDMVFVGLKLPTFPRDVAAPGRRSGTEDSGVGHSAPFPQKIPSGNLT